MTDPWITADELDYTADDQVTWATARIREYCRWHVYPSIESTIDLDTQGGAILVLPTLHLTALGAVTTHVVAIGDDDVGTVTDTLVDPTVLIGGQDGVVTRRDWQQWPFGPGTVTVTFTHGYDELPEALRGVAVSVAKRIPRQMGGVSLEAAGGVQVRYEPFVAGGFAIDEMAVLDRYRLPPRP